MTNENELWEKAAAFHGHVCGGLAIGFQASLYAAKLLKLDFSDISNPGKGLIPPVEKRVKNRGFWTTWVE